MRPGHTLNMSPWNAVYRAPAGAFFGPWAYPEPDTGAFKISRADEARERVVLAG